MNTRIPGPNLHMSRAMNGRNSVAAMRRRWPVAAVAMAAVQAMAQTAGPAVAADGTATTALAELPAVTVRATKREQPIDSVAGSVVLRDDRQLQDAQVGNTQDLERVLPGVQISESASMLFPIVSLRGVSSAQDFYNPALTVYVDGVPQLPLQAIQSLRDVDRVELLKGPQGTLYGKSAQGGVLNIYTREPDDQTRLHLGSGVSSRGGYRLDASASGALVPQMLFGSVALTRENAPGSLFNPVSGADHQGGARTESGTAKLRLAPAGQPWELGLNVSRECVDASQDAYVPWDDIGSRQAYVMSGMPAQYADFVQHRCTTNRSLTARYDLGDWRLTALSAWQDLNLERHYPIGPYHSQQPERWRQNVQEIRAATQGGADRAWDAVVGLYRQSTTQSRHYVNDLPMYGLNGATVDSRNHSLSQAAYGDLTWHLTPRFDLSGGLRASRDEASTQFAGSALNSSYGTDVYAGENRTSGSHVLGKLSASYRWTPAWQGYATVSQGYKPGGFNLAPSSAADAQPYGREQAISYEVGTRWKQGDWRVGASLYRIDTRDAQLYQGDSLGYQTLRNVGDTRSTGVELEAGWQLARNWSVEAGAFFDKATFRRYDDPATCAGCTGNDVPFAPRQMYTLALNGKFATSAGPLRPRLALRHVGAQYFDTANTLRQDAYTVVDASLAWQPSAGVQVSAYVQNLTNRDYRLYGFASALGNMAQVAAPRTVGLMLTYDY